MPETRLRTTRDEVDAFYAAAQQGYWNFDDFMLAGNARFNEVAWNSFEDAGYQRLTRAQQILNCVALFQQQLFQNGVAGVFEFGKDVVHIRSAINEFGWEELAHRFSVLFVDALGSAEPSWPAARERLKIWFDNGDGGFYRGMDFDAWFSKALDEGFLARSVVQYCRSNETDLFEFVG